MDFGLETRAPVFSSRSVSLQKADLYLQKGEDDRRRRISGKEKGCNFLGSVFIHHKPNTINPTFTSVRSPLDFAEI